MAFTRKHKTNLIEQYEDWLKNSQAFFLMEYSKMTVKEVEALRAKVREAGGEAHVVKNTLFKIALDNQNIKLDGDLVNTSMLGFTAEGAPALAKVFADAAKNAELFQIKTGVLDGNALSANDIKALANLPPLDVLRAQLLGVLQAPAGKLVRTLAEPARQVAAVIKAYSEKDAEASQAG